MPCGAHTLNLVVADTSKASIDSMNYFGILRKLFTLFSASTQRWAILKKHVGFSICTVVWYGILSQTHHVSKLMQSPSMQVDVAVSLLNRIEKDLQSYRATDFVTAQMSAKDICEEMNVEAVLQQKREVHKASLLL